MDQQPTTIPEWVATLVGRLALENEAMRLALAAQQAAPAEAEQGEPLG